MEITDSEKLNPLEIFLLVLVEFGLSTPYDLLSKAGLGIGLTSPVLKRLEAGGLLESTPGPRKRLRYSLTSEGEKVLRENLDEGPDRYWQHGRTDVFESSRRGVILSWIFSGVDGAHQGVARAFSRLSVLAQQKKREAQELRESLSRLETDTSTRDRLAAKGLLVATTYQWIKAESDAVLFGLQAEAVNGMHKLVDDLPAPPQVRISNEYGHSSTNTPGK